MALAAAERLNRRRDVERQAKVQAENAEDDGWDARREEEAAADGDGEAGVRGLPRAAPAYGTRKRLLKSSESGEGEMEEGRDVGVLERIGREIGSYF